MNEWIDDHPPIIPELGTQSLPIQLATMVHIPPEIFHPKRCVQKTVKEEVASKTSTAPKCPRHAAQWRACHVGNPTIKRWSWGLLFGIMYETQCHKQLPFGDVKNGFWHWIYHVTPSKKLMLITPKWLIVGMVHWSPPPFIFNIFPESRLWFNKGKKHTFGTFPGWDE